MHSYRSAKALGCPALFALLFAGWCAAEPVRNVILCIGDGMGPEHVKAGRFYHGAPFLFESWQHQGTMTTRSASSLVTDSAASATAMATGVKVNNGVISVATPGDGRKLETVLEFAQNQGRSGGLVTTVPITHATPAAFGAHTSSRHADNEIATNLFERSRPVVLMGGGGNGMDLGKTRAAGYTVVTNRAELLGLKTEFTHTAGLFGTNTPPYKADETGELPDLSEMTRKALEILDKNPKGFFLMVEGGMIDWAGHSNDLERSVKEVNGFARAIEEIHRWAAARTDTLVIVTADHETGGLKVQEDRGAGKLPGATWHKTGHTGVPVPVYLWGSGADAVADVKDNTDVYRLIIGAFSPDHPAALRSRN